MLAKQSPSTSTAPFRDEFTLSQLENDAVMQREIKLFPMTLECYSEELQAEALRRYRFIQWFERRIPGGWSRKTLQPLLLEAEVALGYSAPCWRSLESWRATYYKYGKDITALIPKNYLKGNRNSRIDTVGEAFIEDAIKDFLREEKPSMYSVYDIYKSKVIIENKKIGSDSITFISYEAFVNRVKKLPIYQFINKRGGKYEAEVELQAIDAHIPPARIMERVEIDHTTLDLILLDDELLIPIGRPSLTLMIDTYSHCVVGFNLTFRKPSYESVSCAIINAILNKDYVKEKYPLLMHSWPCHGKPEMLVVDNGVEFWSESIEQSCL